MRNNTTVRESSGRPDMARQPRLMTTIGVDLGDRTSRYCRLNESGAVVKEDALPTTKKALTRMFAPLKRARVVVEAGTHSPWISRLLAQLGHEVIVANPRELALISRSSRKDDRTDARTLARLGQAAPELLRPIRHRSEQAQMDLMRIRVRANLVDLRTGLINATRGLAKSVGERVAPCDADQFDLARLAGLPELLRVTLTPLVLEIERLTVQIKASDGEIEQIARAHYPETARLKQISGVGTLIALTFVLTLDDEQRFTKSRDVGCFAGLRPKRGDSGQHQPQLRISKEGDKYLRKMLVQGAHYILSRRGPDTDLKRWGLQLAASGKNSKKRAVVAVARKLAVLMHALWKSGAVYQPLRQRAA
jgi:transposase